MIFFLGDQFYEIADYRQQRFSGRRAAAHLSALGHQVLTPTHAELDITDKASVASWFQVYRPETVLHCAAISDTGLCQKRPDWSHEINVTGSVNLAEICNQSGAKFIFCSSDQVYHASTLPGPHSESESLTPTAVYARQKLLAEQLCQAACTDTVCLRLSWMYSTQFLPEEHGHLLTLLQDDSLPLTRSVHDFRGITNVDRVVENLPAALSLPAGIYNFGAENDMDTYHTLLAVFKKLGLWDMLFRLAPDDRLPPRDIRMIGTLAASHGIHFESTVDGLCSALDNLH